MARIVQRAPEPQPYQTVCRRCKAVIEFERSDMEFKSDQKDGDFYAGSCPACEYRIWVATSLVISLDWQPY